MAKIEEVRKEAQRLFYWMIKIFETDNVINELFKVHKKLKSKADVFNELANKYVKHVKIIKESMHRRHSLLIEIENLLPGFLKERVGTSEDLSRICILKQINNGCNSFNECYVSIQKGSHAYSQLQTDIATLTKTIDDFAMSRKLEKDEFLSHMKTRSKGIKIAALTKAELMARPKFL